MAVTAWCLVLFAGLSHDVLTVEHRVRWKYEQRDLASAVVLSLAGLASAVAVVAVWTCRRSLGRAVAVGCAVTAVDVVCIVTLFGIAVY